MQEQLDQHQEAGDECSDKRQVLFCPILGCGYLTDGGYKEWREHMITANHYQEETAEKRPKGKLGKVDFSTYCNEKSISEST